MNWYEDHRNLNVETQAMTLTQFLLARIAEDEAAVTSSEADPTERGIEDQRQYARVSVPTARVLAECEAKRRIVENFTPFRGAPQQQVYTSRLLFSLLALPYADRPDYREEWKP